MSNYFSKFSGDKYRWWALVVLALGLAIVIIDNTVLNVAIPYILRDLNTTLDAIQWIVSGYALIIATLLILMGRMGDQFGRKRIFVIGTVMFAVGSFIASIAHSSVQLFFGEAFIEAIGAAMMLTSSLSLLAAEFKGKERAIAFGIWGSVAGASASIGPIIGGYFTTYHSWRWSLRINVVVALVTILGTIFVQESKGEKSVGFDWRGTLLSGAGLFSLVFGFIEAQKYGWWQAKEAFSVFGWTGFANISVVPFAFALSVVLLLAFVFVEHRIEKSGSTPLMRLSMFKSATFTLGTITQGIISMGQFGVFFILPIYVQNVLGFTALKTGVVFLSTSITVMIVGPLSGFLSTKVNPKWVIVFGMITGAVGVLLLSHAVTVGATVASLSPSLILFGIGVGCTVQLSNLVLSSVPINLAGEASAVNSTARQLGTSIGIAILGTILAATLTGNLTKNIGADKVIPDQFKPQIIQSVSQISPGSGQTPTGGLPGSFALAIKRDVNEALVTGSKHALVGGVGFVILGILVSLFIPSIKKQMHE